MFKLGSYGRIKRRNEGWALLLNIKKKPYGRCIIWIVISFTFFKFIEKWWFHKFHLDYVALVHIKAQKKRELMIIWEMQKILRQNNKGVIVSKLLHHFLWVLPKSIWRKIQIQNRCEKLEWRLSPAEGKTTKQEQTSATKSNNVCCMRKYEIVDPTQLNENICKEQITYLFIFFNRL